ARRWFSPIGRSRLPGGFRQALLQLLPRYPSAVPRKRPTYRQTVLLCALLLGGWAYDAALGGGRAHEWAWLAALVLVGGVSALTVRSAQRYLPSPEAAEPSVEPELDLVIRPAAPDQLAELPDIERAADRLFDLAGYGTM